MVALDILVLIQVKLNILNIKEYLYNSIHLKYIFSVFRFSIYVLQFTQNAEHKQTFSNKGEHLLIN